MHFNNGQASISGSAVMREGVDSGSRLRRGAFWALAITLLGGFASASVWSQTPEPSRRQAAIDELVMANHILVNQGVLDGWGHVSIRNPENPNHYLIARAGAPALVTAADIVEYDLDSRPVADAAVKSHGERFIHGEIYRARPDVMAVIHCHCAEVIPFADTGVALRPMYHMAYFVAEGVPVFDIRTGFGMTDMLINTAARGRALAATLGKNSAVLQRGHGATVTATSLHAAVGKAFYLNLNARLQYQAMQLGGKVTFMDPAEARQVEQDYEGAWQTWKAGLPARLSDAAR
jgi:HCOMODA/2-hydroxy-3-carboxy-muconic semialdehyde decarboxylase